MHIIIPIFEFDNPNIKIFNKNIFYHLIFSLNIDKDDHCLIIKMENVNIDTNELSEISNKIPNFKLINIKFKKNFDEILSNFNDVLIINKDILYTFDFIEFIKNNNSKNLIINYENINQKSYYRNNLNQLEQNINLEEDKFILMNNIQNIDKFLSKNYL